MNRGFQAALVFIAALALYIPTLAPTVLWNGGDFAEFQTRAARLEIVPTVWGHPLWVILVHPFTLLPLGDVAYRANLATAVMGAMALALTYLVMRELRASAPAAALAIAALAVSHTFWTYAVTPKAYSLNVLILMGAVLLLLRAGRHDVPASARWSPVVAGLLLGLAPLSHPLLFMALPGALIYIYLRLRATAWRAAVVHFAVGYIAGLVPYLALTIGGGAGASTATVGVNFITQFLTVLITPSLWPVGLLVFAGCLAYQFLFTLAAGVFGLRELWRRDRAAFTLLAVLYLGDAAFVWSWLPITPHLSDYLQNFHFYLPSYVIFALWAALGFDALLRSPTQPSAFRTRLTLLAVLVILPPIVTYAVTPELVRPQLARLGLRDLPGRDIATYLFSPWKQNETGARQLGESILDELPPDAAIFADWNLYGVLRYLQTVEGRRPDVQLTLLPFNGQQLEPILAAASRRTVYIPDTNRYYDINALSAYFDIVPQGPVYRLVPRRSG